MNRHEDAYTPRTRGNEERLVGDDLTDENLDELWNVFSGDFDLTSEIHNWWCDKPHQIAYRLLLRLTRAETKLKEIQNEESSI